MKIDPRKQPDMIVIVCEASSHESKKNAVQDFTWMGDWNDGDNWMPSAPFGIDATTRARQGQSEVWLEGDKALDRRDKDAFNAALARPTEKRVKYNLKCDLCGLSVSIRHASIEPILDKLRAVGVSQPSLALIASIVSKS